MGAAEGAALGRGVGTWEGKAVGAGEGGTLTDGATVGNTHCAPELLASPVTGPITRSPPPRLTRSRILAPVSRVARTTTLDAVALPFWTRRHDDIASTGLMASTRSPLVGTSLSSQEVASDQSAPQVWPSSSTALGTLAPHMCAWREGVGAAEGQGVGALLGSGVGSQLGKGVGVHVGCAVGDDGAIVNVGDGLG